MSKTEGPWYLHQMTTYEFMVAHKNYGPRKYNYQDGVKVVQELNKLEAVREAAPELLAACKAVRDICIHHLASYIHEPTYKQVLDAIEKAEQS